MTTSKSHIYRLFYQYGSASTKEGSFVGFNCTSFCRRLFCVYEIQLNNKTEDGLSIIPFIIERNSFVFFEAN